MQKLKNLIENELKTELYEASFTLRSDKDKNITIVTDNLRGVCGITVVTVIQPATAVSSSIERTTLKVKFFMLEASMREQLVRMARDATKIDGVFSFIPQVRTARRVFSRIYRSKTTATAEE
jgi:hypothetical protein